MTTHAAFDDHSTAAPVPQRRLGFTAYLRANDERVSPGLMAGSVAVAGALLFAFYSVIPQSHAGGRPLPPLAAQAAPSAETASASREPYVAYAAGAPAAPLRVAAPVDAGTNPAPLSARTAVMRCTDGLGNTLYTDVSARCGTHAAEPVVAPRADVLMASADTRTTTLSTLTASAAVAVYNSAEAD